MKRLAVSAALLIACAAALAQRIDVLPAAEVLAGDPVSIVVRGLAPGARVTLTAERPRIEWNGPQLFRATASFVADATGVVALDRTAPESGSYTGVDPRGLFWSATPIGPVPQPDWSPAEVRLVATVDGKPASRAVIRFRDARPDVAVEELGALFPGAVYAARPVPAGGKRPALILLGGSEGGSSMTRLAPGFASRGYAVLALPYYSPLRFGPTGLMPAELPALPASFVDIPVERLEQARAWLAARPEVDTARIGVYGVSKGAEFALIAASRMAWIRCVVAVVPSDVVWEGWGPDAPRAGVRSSFAFEGKPLPFVPYQHLDKELAGFQTLSDVKLRRPHDAGRALHPDRVTPARIAVEAIAAPVLVVGGDDDQVWDSGGMARAIAQRRSTAGLPTVALIYPRAGHAIGGTGWLPTTTYNAGPMKMGGTPQADAQAQADAWPKTLSFLAATLQPPAD
jgi:dienelactone hydrolase